MKNDRKGDDATFRRMQEVLAAKRAKQRAHKPAPPATVRVIKDGRRGHIEATR